MEFDDGTVRKLRKAYNSPRRAHELTFTCYHRFPLLSKDRTRLWFVDALNSALTKHDFAAWAWVVMPEHAHVLVFPRPETYDMAAFLKSVKQPVGRRAIEFLRGSRESTWLDRLRVEWPGGRTEHRFWQQGGGYDRDMLEKDAIWASIAYLHNNPVRRKLVAQATEWEWSSARHFAGMGESTVRVDTEALPR